MRSLFAACNAFPVNATNALCLHDPHQKAFFTFLAQTYDFLSDFHTFARCDAGVTASPRHVVLLFCQSIQIIGAVYIALTQLLLHKIDFFFPTIRLNYLFLYCICGAVLVVCPMVKLHWGEQGGMMPYNLHRLLLLFSFIIRLFTPAISINSQLCRGVNK